MESTGTWQTRRMRDADDSLFSLNLAASSSPAAGGQASSGPSPPTTSDRPWPAPLHLVHQQLVLNELRHGDVASKELLLDSHGPPLPVQEGCLKYNYNYWAIFRGGGVGGRAAFSKLLGFVLFSICLPKLEKFTVYGTQFQVVCLGHCNSSFCL